MLENGPRENAGFKETCPGQTYEVRRYNGLAICFHWVTALLFLIAYASIYYRTWVAGSDGFLLYKVHTFVGMMAGLAVVLRIAWNRISPPPEFDEGERIERLAAKAMHLVLYGFMIIMPLTGYMGQRSQVIWLSWTGLPAFGETWAYDWLVNRTLKIAWDTFEAPVDALHQALGSYVLWALIFIHAAAAIFHHVHRRDGVLIRMLPGLKPRGH